MEKPKMIRAYLNIAKEISKLSHANRRKVGAILVKKGNIISFGFNGTAAGFDNACEHGDESIVSTESGPNNDLVGTTKREVLHAESNAITKCAKGKISSKKSTLYVTLSPCYECAKLIIQSGISKVYYSEEYRDTTGLDLLTQAKISVIQIIK